MKLETDEEETPYWVRFVLRCLVAVPVILIVRWLWPSVIPFGVFELWRIRGGLFDWLFAAWPIFVWAVSVNIVFQIIRGYDALLEYYEETRASPAAVFLTGVVGSLFAGVVEEIGFRWLIFLAGIVGLKIVNFLFFGFLGFGLTEWLYLHFFGPIANWTTLGALQPQLFHVTGWAVGSAILASNVFFRDGHRCQGLFGWLNSWFIGMFLFWIMFRYGLLAAIVVHTTYDLLVDLVATATYSLVVARNK